MWIKEAAKHCNLTKKAIVYYMERGLVQPEILENGYRDFKEEDVETLKQIGLYRKLGLTISEIKAVLADRGYLKSIVNKKMLELEEEKVKQSILQRLCDGEAPEMLEAEIGQINSGTIITKRLTDLFPSYFGKFISLNFSRYLTGKIETEEQMQAFREIIDFFDSVPEPEIPEDLREYLDSYLETYTGERGEEIMRQVIREKERYYEDMDAFTEQNREVIDAYLAYRKTEEFQNSPANRLMVLMKQFCMTQGYYQKFIPAMRRLSPLYNTYYEQMLKADAQFFRQYPELYGEKDAGSEE